MGTVGGVHWTISLPVQRVVIMLACRIIVVLACALLASAESIRPSA